MKSEDGAIVEEMVKHETKLLSKRVKTEPEENERQVLEIKDRTVRSTKRRKKA